MWGRNRFEEDLDRWQSRGWVTADGANAIRADRAQRGSGVQLSSVLAVLGVVLLAFAAMSFVAANWQDMSKLTRLALLLGGIVGSYAGAAHLFQRQQDGFAHALVLLGVALFGAAIMLVAQMYHIEGNPPDAVLTWTAGAVLAGVAFKSRPALALAMLLIGLWGAWQTDIRSGVYWPFLLGWAAVAATLLWARWRPGLHLALAVLSIWIASLGFTLLRGHAHHVVAVVGLVASAAAGAVYETKPQWRAVALTTLCYAMGVAFAGLFALQFIDERALRGLAPLAGIAALTIALLVAAVVWGWKRGERSVMWLGYAGFSVEILALYFKTVGTLLGSSMFFLLAGLIVVALALVARRLMENAPSAVESRT